MKGSNDLILNEATMIEAMQYWLNSQMVAAPRVVSVKRKQTGLSDQFRIELDSTPERLRPNVLDEPRRK